MSMYTGHVLHRPRCVQDTLRHIISSGWWSIKSTRDIKSGRYYTEAVNWAASNEIVLGYDENRFGPDDSITREQLAAILYRYAAYLGMDTGIYETEDSSAIKSVIFEDSSNISQYAQSAASWASSRGLVKGTDRGMFMPKEIATRAQAAEILMRFSELAEN